MERPRAPYRELTDEENVDILGTLNPGLWAAFQRAWARFEFFELPHCCDALERSVMMTGAIGGDHRRDLSDALKGQRPPTMALGVPVTATEPNGHVKPEARVPRL